MRPSKEDIQDQLAYAQIRTESRQTHPDHKHLSFEDGVEAALLWVLGEEDEAPMPEDE